MVKSNFDDLGFVGQLEMRATTFILGVWGHVVEEVVEKLGFPQKSGSPEWIEIQTMTLVSLDFLYNYVRVCEMNANLRSRSYKKINKFLLNAKNMLHFWMSA